MGFRGFVGLWALITALVLAVGCQSDEDRWRAKRAELDAQREQRIEAMEAAERYAEEREERMEAARLRNEQWRAEKCEHDPGWCERYKAMLDAPPMSRRSAPSRTTYVDCNSFGVVNEDTDRAYRAADRGHRCRKGD